MVPRDLLQKSKMTRNAMVDWRIGGAANRLSIIGGNTQAKTFVALVERRIMFVKRSTSEKPRMDWTRVVALVMLAQEAYSFRTREKLNSP